MFKHFLYISAAALLVIPSVGAAELNLTNPEAKKLLRFEHGTPDGWKIVDGKLTLTPAPDNGIRLGISEAAVPTKGYRLSTRINFPDAAASGHAGIQVRRQDGKACYVFISPNGRAVAISGVGDKLIEAPLPPPPPDGHRLEIDVDAATLDVAVDGQYCFSLDNLPGIPGGVAFFAYMAPVEYSEFSLTELPASSRPVPKAIYSEDFSRPATALKRMALLHGSKENFSVTPGALELRDAATGSGICVQLGGTEGLSDFKLSAEVSVAPGNGHGGFQLRRDGGKLFYVFLTAGNRAVGSYKDSAALPVSAPGSWATLEVECIGNTATVSVDGKPYLKFDDLTTREGAICVAAFGCNIKFRDVVVTSVEK